MNDQKMRLVGGPPRRLPMSCYTISKAECGDSRLMGVIGLYIHWVIKPEFAHSEELERDYTEALADIHQVYCFELEEDGLDRVSELEGNDSVKLGKMKNGVFGGLGSKMKALTEREALYIIDKYSGEAARKFTKMPAGVAQVMAMASKELEILPFSAEELFVLNEKLCVRITTYYGLVNYYVMRNVCYDFEGADLLKSRSAKKEDLKPLVIGKKASLIKNKADLFSESADSSCFMCESYLDTQAGPYIMISEVTVNQTGVISSRVMRSFKITDNENYHSLVRSEYLTYFDIASGDIDKFNEKLAAQIPRASCKMYGSGILYMDYFTTNRHVEREEFNIGDDLKASYYVAAGGQLVMASYSLQGIVAAETMVKTSGLEKELRLRERFNFVTPVLGQFVESGYENFDSFLSEIL